MRARFALKAATDDLHDDLDRRLGALDLANAEQYARFLSVQGRAVPPLETALADGGLERLVPGWGASRRSTALQADLTHLGMPMPNPLSVPPIRGDAALLGTAYVLEGSRLGARILVRRVGTGMPTQFLSDHAPSPWPTLVAALDRALYSPALVEAASDSARATFALFLKASSEAGLE